MAKSALRAEFVNLLGKKINHDFSRQVVTFEELLISQAVQQEALTGRLVERGAFTKHKANFRRKGGSKWQF